MKYNLLNTTTLLADDKSEARYDLITGGMNSFAIDFFPRFDQFPFKNFNTIVWLKTGILFQNRSYPKVHRIKIWGRWRLELLWSGGVEIVGRNRWWNYPYHLWSSHTSSPPCFPPKWCICWENYISSDIQYIKHYFTLYHILITLIIFELNSKIIVYTSGNNHVYGCLLNLWKIQLIILI